MRCAMLARASSAASGGRRDSRSANSLGVDFAVPAARALADADAAARARAARRAERERREEREWRRAWEHVRACDEGACRELWGAVITQAVDDIRSGSPRFMHDALFYLLAADGEAGWHCTAVGIDMGALRERARALLAERFGDEGERLWLRVSRLVGGEGRRVT